MQNQFSTSPKLTKLSQFENEKCYLPHSWFRYAAIEKYREPTIQSEETIRVHSLFNAIGDSIVLFRSACNEFACKWLLLRKRTAWWRKMNGFSHLLCVLCNRLYNSTPIRTKIMKPPPQYQHSTLRTEHGEGAVSLKQFRACERHTHHSSVARQFRLHTQEISKIVFAIIRFRLVNIEPLDLWMTSGWVIAATRTRCYAAESGLDVRSHVPHELVTKMIVNDSSEYWTLTLFVQLQLSFHVFGGKCDANFNAASDATGYNALHTRARRCGSCSPIILHPRTHRERIYLWCRRRRRHRKFSWIHFCAFVFRFLYGVYQRCTSSF